MTGVVSKAEIDIVATPGEVWHALTDPELIAEYFFGTRVETSWVPGSTITWSGEYEGRPYRDKGEIIDVDLNRRLTMTHYSPMSGMPDEPGSYHTLAYELAPEDGRTHVRLSQDNNGDQAEADRTAGTWATVLAGLKKTVEARR
jgi:uncharacterized protein YndB with AHSA1/START domain